MMITDAKMQVIMEAFKFEILKSKVNLFRMINFFVDFISCIRSAGSEIFKNIGANIWKGNFNISKLSFPLKASAC